jgi:hypothetical protein
LEENLPHSEQPGATRLVETLVGAVEEADSAAYRPRR